MTSSYLEYPLQRGYVNNWLVAGPHAIAVPDLARFAGPDYKSQIARHYYKRISDINEPPVEKASFLVGDDELAWRYYRCLDDHFVDVSSFYHTCHYLRAWAYTQVVTPASSPVTFTLTTNGPADLWLNGQHVHRHEHFFHQDPHSVSFEVTLNEGRNEILVRFEEVAARECPYVMALQVAGLDAEGVSVQVPTYIERVARRQMFEHAFEQAHLEQSVSYQGNDITLRWADDLDTRCSYCFRVQDSRDRIYVEGQPEAKPDESVNVGQPARLRQGQYHVVLMPRPEEFYSAGVRYQRRLPIQILDHAHSDLPYATYEERRREALEDAVRQEHGLYSEIAKYGLGRGASADAGVMMEAIEGINQREDCSDFYLVGLLGVMYRYLGSALFPPQLRGPLESCVLNFKYWHDEPGSDAMCYTTENHSILFHTCEILAGQLYPDRVFPNAGQTGQWHREKGERLALDWLHKRGTEGFTEWDSNCYFEEDLVALSHLADLAENDDVQELAAVVMDKLFLTMALNSFKGVFGSTHGRTYAPMILGGQLEATSGISRLMWGMGVWNPHIRGTVSLACSEYELPSIIADIATDTADELWNRERHGEVNKVTYRTPDYMLCSAQDYHPGEKGYQQHVWQATLGHDAVVFVTHPPSMGEDGSHRPNFWHGNYVLPRVAQWKDTLVAVHKLPEDDWMGFTHAYYPVHSFDAHVLRDGWAFAQKGSGYLALTAARGIELVKHGPSAYRELRSHGRENVWLCLMGRTATDGSFEDFQKKVLALEVDLQDLGVSCTTLRGETLSFGWEGPLTVNGQEQPLSGYAHYDNPYCRAEWPASAIEIQYGDYMLRLHFDLGEQPV
jgi:hypothetical protein